MTHDTNKFKSAESRTAEPKRTKKRNSLCMHIRQWTTALSLMISLPHSQPELRRSCCAMNGDAESVQHRGRNCVHDSPETEAT